MTPARMSRYGAVLVAAAAFSLGAMAPAQAAPTNGANSGCGAYCPFGTDQPSGNGYGRTNNPHLAGEQGSADSKFPPGQSPDGSDDNNGYECDGNGGVGQTNPAHSGCGEEEPPS